MTTSKHLVSDYSELHANALKQFGTLLRKCCEESGLSQGILSRQAKAELKSLLKQGAIKPGELVGSLEQPAISRVYAGLQAPGYFQVLIMLRVVRKRFGSEDLAEFCERMQIPLPAFSAEMECLLWSLAGFLPPEERQQAYAQSVQMPKLGISLVAHREERFQANGVMSGKERNF